MAVQKAPDAMHKGNAADGLYGQTLNKVYDFISLHRIAGEGFLYDSHNAYSLSVLIVLNDKKIHLYKLNHKFNIFDI